MERVPGFAQPMPAQHPRKICASSFATASRLAGQEILPGVIGQILTEEIRREVQGELDVTVNPHPKPLAMTPVPSVVDQKLCPSVVTFGRPPTKLDPMRSTRPVTIPGYCYPQRLS